MGIIITIILVCCAAFAFGQSTPVTDEQQPDRPVTISLLSNYYDQDGEHGAVNGGSGSQKLNSFSQEASIFIPVEELSGATFHAGVDHFTSASLRLIDKYKTSASAAQGNVSGDETRVYANIGYDFGNKPKHSIFSLGAGYSKEYDVNSYKLSLGWTKEFPEKNLVYKLGLELVADRWLVIYPGEFRTQVTQTVVNHNNGDDDDDHDNDHDDDDDDDHDEGDKPGRTTLDGESGASSVTDSTYTEIPVGYATPIVPTGKTAEKNGKTYPVDWRYSVNVTNKLSYVINERMNGAVGLDMSLQSGLLSSPFYRVYFNDGVKNELDKEVRVETLPRLRIRAALYTRYDYQVTNVIGLRTMLRGYADTWSILGLTASAEVPVKATTWLSVVPFYRISLQKGSKYFAGYGEHIYEPGAFFTSDYDLSSFTSQKIGGALRIAPLGQIAGIKNENRTKNIFSITTMGLRYAYFTRSDGFKSHSVSFEINLSL